MGRKARGEELTAIERAAAGHPSALAVTLPAPEIRLIRGEHPAIARVRNAKRPPKAWVDDLATVAPRSERLPWLMLAHHGAADRWVVYVAIPDATVDGHSMISPERRMILSGKPWWELPTSQQAGRKHTVSAFQWEMYRKHRVDTRPFWCLQGTEGGTPAIYSDIEKAILKAQGMPVDPPAPGALCYADWTERTKQQVVARDRLARMGMNVALLMAKGDNAELKRVQDEADLAYRKAFTAWFSDTLAPQADFLDWFSKRTEADMQLRQPSKAEGIAIDRAAEEYVETGIIPNHRLIKA